MEVFGNKSAEQQLSEYKQPEIPESVWKSLAQQKTTAGAKGMQELGAGVSSFGHSVGGFLKKQEAESEASGEQNISFMRNSDGNLVPTSSGDGGFLFGANGPSAMPTSDGVTNLFNSVLPEFGSAEHLGTAAAKDGTNLSAMTNMMNVSSVQAANVVIAGEIQAMRQKYEGNPDGFRTALFSYADTLKSGMPGKVGNALYNAAVQHGGQHLASMVSDKFTQNKHEAWDTIEAGIKRDMQDTMSFARQFPGSFDDLKKSGVYQKVLTGYASMNGNPIFSGRMTKGKMQEASYDFEQDALKSWAIGHAERLRDAPGGSIDKAQAWLMSEFKAKGRDDIFNAGNSHILWKTEAQKDAIEANNAVVNQYTSAYLTGQGVPDSSQIDWAIRNSESVGDFMGALRLRAARQNWNDRKSTAGAPMINRIQGAMSGPTYPGQPVPDTAIPNLDTNFNAANDALHMNAQEQYLYNMHRRNLIGPGGVDNKDGSRSSLLQTTVSAGGRVYNVPTVWNGKVLDMKTDEGKRELRQNIAKAGGLENFPSYKTEKEAEERYGKMHDYMEKDTKAVLDWRNNRTKTVTTSPTTYGGAYPQSTGPSDYSDIQLIGGAKMRGAQYAFGNMNPDFRDRLAALMRATKAAGYDVKLESGWRSQEHQDELFAHSDHSGHLVAKHSHHTDGFAADVKGAGLDYMHQHAAEYGLRFPMPYEKWHIELARGAEPMVADDSKLHLFGSRGTGFGAINMVYQGGFDQAGPSGFSPNQMFSHLKNIGATDNEARMLTAAAGAESKFDHTAWHDNGTGYGLFGHKLGRLDMRGKSWQEQATAALQELRSTKEGQMVNAAQTPEELTRAMMFYERPQGFRTDAPEQGHNYTGRLNTVRRFYGLAGGRELPQVAAPGDMRSGPRRYTDAEYTANPYLAVAESQMRARDDKFEVAQAQQSLPLMSAAARQGVPLPEPVLMHMQQLVDQHPELEKPWAEFQQAYTAHPAAAQVAGMQDPHQYIENIRNQARTTGDISMMAYADEMEKQVNAMQQDFKDNPQRAAARPDVGILQRQPPGMADAFETNNAPEAFKTVMTEKRNAGNAITNRFGGDLMNNTIMGSDVKGIVNKLSNTDAQGVTNVLTTIQGGMSKNELSAMEQNKDFTGAITGLSYSDDIGKARAAMGYLDARWRTNPEEFNATFPKMRERLVAWQRNTQFKGEAFAQKMQQRALDPNEQAAMEANKSLAREELKKMKPQDMLAGLQTNFLGRNSFSYDKAKQALDSDRFSAKDVAIQDFQERYTDYRANGLDAAAARDAAIEDLQFKWNTSELNGGRFMAYPPEMNGHYAPINGSTQWVTDQLRDDIADIAERNKLSGLYWNPEGKNTTFGRDYETALVSDKTTQAEWANGVPSYRILVKNAEGNFIPLMDKNKQGQMVEARFYPDRQKALQEAKSGFWIERNRQGLPGQPMPQANPGLNEPDNNQMPPALESNETPIASNGVQ